MKPGPAGILLLLGSVLLPTVCGNSDSQDTPTTSYKIRHRYLQELSGLAVSRKNPNWLWVHNDRGDGSFLYAMKLDGGSAFRLKIAKASANDWEDICLGRDSSGKDWLFIADTGRKKELPVVEPRQCVWVIAEPALPAAALPVGAKDGANPKVPEFSKKKSKKATRIDLYFPKDRDPDVEAMFCLPGMRGLGFVEKKKKGGKCRVYRGLFPASSERNFPDRLQLETYAELSIPGKDPIDRRITSACLDSSGTQLYVISRTGLFRFPWPPWGKIEASSKKNYKEAIKPRGSWALPKLQQSEAIDIATNNKELVIVSEGKPAVFHVFNMSSLGKLAKPGTASKPKRR